MISVFYGTDTDTSRTALTAARKALAPVSSLAEQFILEGKQVTVGRLLELAHGQGLFAGASVVVVREALAESEGREIVLKALPQMASSANTFFLWERGTIDAKTKTTIKKYATEMVEFAQKQGVDSSRFTMGRMGGGSDSPFALADALGSRDRKKLWVLFTKARLEGKVIEEIHGMFLWQVKTILAASQSKSAAEAGLSPFPFQKARTFARNYTETELRTLARDLVALYHNARRGGESLETGLERWVLST